MSEPALRLVDPETGDSQESSYAGLGVPELVTLLERSARELNGYRLKCGRLERELDEVRVGTPESKQVREVLLYWRPRCMPKAKIVAGSPRWLKVKDRLADVDAETGERAYDVAGLCEAVDGALLSSYHVENGYLDASTIFRDAGTVDQHRARAHGAAASASRDLRDMPPGLRDEWLIWLAEDCGCGHGRVLHLHAREGCCASADGKVCRCDGFHGAFAGVGPPDLLFELGAG